MNTAPANIFNPRSAVYAKQSKQCTSFCSVDANTVVDHPDKKELIEKMYSNRIQNRQVYIYTNEQHQH